MVQVQGVQFQYGEEGPRMTFPDFSCQPGDRMLLLGQSGTGKTTLLHLLCGMLKAQAGTLNVAGQDLRAASDREKLILFFWCAVEWAYALPDEKN